MLKMYKIISVVLVAVFVCSCIAFYSASVYAEPDEQEEPVTQAEPTEVIETEPPTEEIPTETEPPEEPQTEAPTESPTVSITESEEPDTTRRTVTERITVEGGEEPSYTEEHEEQEEEEYEPEEEREHSNTTFNKTVKSTKRTTTEPTVAKKVTDYGKKYRVAKWFALGIAVLALVAMVVVNRLYFIKKRELMHKIKKSKNVQNKNGDK